MPPNNKNTLPPGLPAYAELWSLSNFSFLRGASHPQELIERAAQLGYSALALTDECSLAGIVRAHVAAKQHKLKLLVGAQFRLQAEEGEDAPAPNADDAAATLVLLACNLNGYGNLCQFITRLRRAGDKGTYAPLRLSSLDPDALADCLVLAAPSRGADVPAIEGLARRLAWTFTNRCWLLVSQLRQVDDALHLERLREVAARTGVPLVAAGDVHMHRRSRKPLQDVLTATRLRRPLTLCGFGLQPNAERHLRTRLRLAQTCAPELLAQTLEVAARCGFSLDELRYHYPGELVPAGHSPATWLRQLTWEGAGRRWPGGIPPAVQAQVEHELALIGELRYEHYFLTVADIVEFARSRGILCQGRGSAANSVVCFCLGVTEVDPARMSLLFERFISRERNEPPDIDIDFEHERREEVIQYLYRKYGRDRAALAATVITYRMRSAVRDVGKALGLADATVEALARDHQWWDGAQLRAERFAQLGLDPGSLLMRQFTALVDQLLGFPRHLSQHTGGFVLTQGPLSRLVPIENAAMAERTVIEWDKDDLDAVGLLKVDVLALGMLTALRKALDFIGQLKGHAFGLQDIPDDDVATYDMVCRADTVGVFQIESRAQQAMLPRLRPRCFYDLVIEVAIVRPGPIQGGMVHPFLRRREGKEAVTFPGEALRQALGRTLGVPVFQEQVMQVAILAAGFTAGEADALRRSMAAWRRKGGLEQYHDKIVRGMTQRGYDPAFATAIFEQIKGFSEYGFPESHAASFALLVYTSCWIKCRHPAAFLAAMLNSQPLGFYTPWQLVQDARRHGVEVRAADVMASDWDCTLEGIDAEAGSDEANKAAEAAREKGAEEEKAGKKVEEVEERAEEVPQADDPWHPDSQGASPPTSSSPRRRGSRRPHAGAQEQRQAARTQDAAHAKVISPDPLGGRLDSRLRGNDGVGGGAGQRTANALQACKRCSGPDDPVSPTGPSRPSKPAVRLGLRMVAGLSQEAAMRIAQARALCPFDDVEDLARRARLDARDIRLLAGADALMSLAGHRRQQLWEAAAWTTPPALLGDAPVNEDFIELPPAPEGEEIVFDHAATGLTLRRHPLALLRPLLEERRLLSAAQLLAQPHGRLVRACGLVTLRQQPGTAKGVVFVTLEDETGVVQVVCWKRIRERQREVLLRSRLLAVYGRWQREGEVCALVAGHLLDLTGLLGRFVAGSRDFR
ncbi:error-prone DNA polymerase [Azohydromonas lata]|uniref:Error-prone DNA polymerase n=1 Tax=Azohydromonas lata TaxID=45677 RepID=A0ABU5ILK7_9BURK|nr:error-prone DNA polymerase [Azohydromonas lata]MDZ5459795.1 error-prone DNA polymerase [Azohydromonas lata]